MEHAAENVKLLDALNRIIIVARLTALTSGDTKDIAYFLDQAHYLLADYFDNELDSSAIRQALQRVGERAPGHRDYLLEELPSPPPE